MRIQVIAYVNGHIIEATMSPLPRGALARRIEHLAASVGFPLHRIYVYDGTTRCDTILALMTRAYSTTGAESEAQ